MRKHSRHTCLVLILILMGSNVLWAQKTYYDEALYSWEESIPPPESEIYHSILLIGDIKYPATDSTHVMLMKDKLSELGDKGSVLVLGDIVYPHGLPSPESKEHKAAKADMDIFQ